MEKIFKNKLWWFLLPLSTLFLVFYLAFKTLPPQPFTYWWDFPLMVTYFGIFVLSLYKCLKEI